ITDIHTRRFHTCHTYVYLCRVIDIADSIYCDVSCSIDCCCYNKKNRNAATIDLSKFWFIKIV
ncbi:MAG: hypothetical protein MR030_02720, partial [Bacteroidales bacterium]|nr:hypothetical protein [Bacteroidales bacterium]